MEYKEHIKKAVEYIENNLKNETSIADCAKAAGYSVYHFLRVFTDIVKFTPADYIRKRRLTEITKKMIEQSGNISDAAFEYGFNSKENFVRAFKREHHILPTEYKYALNSLKLYEPFSFDCFDLDFELQPRIITLEGFNLTGYKSDEDYAPNFWNKYNSRGYSKRLSDGKVCADYGVCIWNDEKNKLDYFIGIRESDALGDTSGTSSLGIKGGLYAVFATPATTHYDFVNTIHKTWYYIYNVWFPKSRYKRACGYEFETYTEESRTFSEDIYIPVEEK